jgi:hypothetical protein
VVVDPWLAFPGVTQIHVVLVVLWKQTTK